MYRRLTFTRINYALRNGGKRFTVHVWHTVDRLGYYRVDGLNIYPYAIRHKERGKRGPLEHVLRFTVHGVFHPRTNCHLVS